MVIEDLQREWKNSVPLFRVNPSFFLCLVDNFADGESKAWSWLSKRRNTLRLSLTNRPIIGTILFGMGGIIDICSLHKGMVWYYQSTLTCGLVFGVHHTWWILPWKCKRQIAPTTSAKISRSLSIN